MASDVDDDEEPQAPVKKPSSEGSAKVAAAPRKNVKTSIVSEPHSAAKPASPIESDFDVDLNDDYDSLVEYDDAEEEVDDLGSHDSPVEESVQRSTSKQATPDVSGPSHKRSTTDHGRPSPSEPPTSDWEMPSEPLLEPLTFGLQIDTKAPDSKATDSSNQTPDEERSI